MPISSYSILFSIDFICVTVYMVCEGFLRQTRGRFLSGYPALRTEFERNDVQLTCELRGADATLPRVFDRESLDNEETKKQNCRMIHERVSKPPSRYV